MASGRKLAERPPLRKRLGQHHLRSGRLCKPLVDFLRPREARVLEIGPGGGVLTGELLAAGARVLAVEADPAWAFVLRRQHRGSRLALAVADALTLEWSRVPEGTLVAGNLPYRIATPLIERALAEGHRFPRLAFLVQLEVAQRLAAPAGTRTYGALTVLTAARAAVAILSRVARGSFRPAPKVDGAFVGLTPREPPLAPREMEEFAAWVRAVFGQRRKTLRNALARIWGRSEAERALARAGIDPSRRAQTLALEAFLGLYRRRPSAESRLA